MKKTSPNRQDLNLSAMTEFNNVVIQDTGGALPSGLVAFSNASRFEAANFNEPLTAYAVGYQDPEDLWGVLAAMIPDVPVPRRFNFKKQDQANAFLTEVDDVRAPGAPFKHVEFLGDEVNARTFNKGLTMFIDEEEMELEGIEQIRTGYLIQRLARNEIVRFISMLDAAATNTNQAWVIGAAASVDPDQNMQDVLDLAQQTDGIWKNTGLVGKTAWLKRKKAFRGQLTAGSLASAQMTPQDLAAELSLDNVVINDKVRQVTSTTKARLVGAAVYFYYMLPGVTKDDPSDFKRFTSTARGGGKFGVFRKEHDNGVSVTVQHNSTMMLTTGLSIPKITVA